MIKQNMTSSQINGPRSHQLAMAFGATDASKRFIYLPSNN